LIFRPTEIADVVAIDVEPRGDERGFLARTYCRSEFADRGMAMPVVQCSTVFSPRRDTLRGLHYQQSPHWEIKLIRCTRGAAFVVAVDLRDGSRTLHEWGASS